MARRIKVSPGRGDSNADGHGSPVAIAFREAPAAGLGAQIEALGCMTIAELRNAWSRSFGEVPPGQGRDLLRRQLAWRLQARAYGDLCPNNKRRIRRLHQTFEADPGFTPSPTFDLPPGTVLTRAWQGVLHRVQVLQGGFAYGGEQFSSLSEVARHITGTRWSGPAFFGLKVPGKTK
jgi:hypothetical protein